MHLTYMGLQRNMWDLVRPVTPALTALLLMTDGTSLAAKGRLLYRDDFRHGLGDWVVEAAKQFRNAAG